MFMKLHNFKPGVNMLKTPRICKGPSSKVYSTCQLRAVEPTIPKYAYSTTPQSSHQSHRQEHSYHTHNTNRHVPKFMQDNANLSKLLIGVGVGTAIVGVGYYTFGSDARTHAKWEEEETKSFPVVQGIFTGLAVLVSVAGLYVMTRYKRCPANQVMVVQGAMTKGGAKCIHGGGTFVWPVAQEYQYMSLTPMHIHTPLEGALSLENIRVNVPSNWTIAISTDPAVMINAAVRLLGLTRDAIANQAKDIIFGQLRLVVASMQIEDITRSRERFVNQVTKNVEEELNHIGLHVVNVNITNIEDQSGYLEALGKKAAEEAIQNAAIQVSEQTKLGNIGVTTNNKDAALSIAELNRQREVGEAQAKYSKEASIRDQEREMRIKVANANAEAIKGENLAKEEIALSNAKLSIRQAEAFRETEIKKKESEAEIRERQAIAEAKAALEAAKRVEAEKRAELEAPAKAIKAKILVDAEAKAQESIIHAKGISEAAFAQMEAEAKGQIALLQAKAEGLKNCGGAKEAFQLLMLEHIDKLAETAAKSISNIKFDKIVVWDQGSNANGLNTTANFIRGIASSLPPTMNMMKDIAGIQMPSYFGSIVNDADTTDMWTKRQKLIELASAEHAEEQRGNKEKAAEIRSQKESLLAELSEEADRLKQKLLDLQAK